MNPLTLLFCGFSAWIAVLGVNELWFSALVVVVCSLRRLPMVLGLSLPLFLSLAVIHWPAGHPEVALSLGVRGTALIAVMLCVSSYISVAELAKALQGLGVSPKLTYVLGNAINLLPMGQRYVTIYRESAVLQGRRSMVRYVAFPLITRLLVMSSARELPLSTSGVLLPGPRTVLRPAAFRGRDWVAVVFAGVGLLMAIFPW